MSTEILQIDIDAAQRRMAQMRELVATFRSLPASATKSAKARPSWLYLMQIGDEGPVKIGVTHDVEARRKTLSTASPYPINVRFIGVGLAHRERMLHARFDHLRMNGEWFRSSPEIFDYFRNEVAA